MVEQKTLGVCMSFFDYITGGNAKVAANSLANIHYMCDCDYVNTYTALLDLILKMAIQNMDSKTRITLEMVRNNEFQNYTDLAVLNLNLNAAPASATFLDTYTGFNRDIAKYLIKRNITMQLVAGDNRHLTKSIAECLL